MADDFSYAAGFSNYNWGDSLVANAGGSSAAFRGNDPAHFGSAAMQSGPQQYGASATWGIQEGEPLHPLTSWSDLVSWMGLTLAPKSFQESISENEARRVREDPTKPAGVNWVAYILAFILVIFGLYAMLK